MKYAVLPAILTLIYSGALLASNNSTPDVNWYQADLVVFLQPSADTSKEKWPEVIPHPKPAHARTLTPYNTYQGNMTGLPPMTSTTGSNGSTDISRTPFIALPETEYQITDQISTLKRSSGFKVLTSMAWRLPVDSDDSDQSVIINTPLTTNSTFQVNGSITVSARRFLHVDVDLWYNELKPEALSSLIASQNTNRYKQKNDGKINPPGMLQPLSSTQEAPLKIARNFQLQERRRIQKTSEVQYLDSPVIGVLFKLTPYDPPESENIKPATPAEPSPVMENEASPAVAG